MNFVLLAISFSFIVSLSSTSTVYPSNIRAIAILFRHGERTPSTTYPNDPYIEHFNQTGWGKLTPVGCRRLYTFGKFMSTQFPQLHRRVHTELTSSAATRCIDSVKCFMDGLNYNIRVPRRYRNLIRAESPITTLPLDEDPILNHANLRCPAREREKNADPKVKALIPEYQELFDNLTKVTGENYTDAYFAIGQRFDPIKIEHQLGLKLPEWVTQEFLNDSITIHDKLFGYMGQWEIEKKLSGTFLQKLINQLDSSEKKQLSLFVHGSHDTTLAPIMATLDMWRGKRPKNGEGVVFTLTNDDKLNMFYYHQNVSLSQWKPPGCDSCCGDCYLQDFHANVTKFIPHSWREECQLPN